MAGWSGGAFTRARNWAQDKINAINPQAALFDQEDDNFASGLNNCVTKDGTNKPSATMDWNAQRLTNLGDATAATDAMNRQSADARYSQIGATPKRKASDTTRASTTTLTDDPDLIAALAASSIYSFDLGLYVLPAAGGLRIMMNYSGTFTSAPSWFTSHGVLNGALSSGGGIVPVGGGFNFGGAGAAGDWYRVFGTLITTGAGNLSLQWCQGSSNVANSTVKAGSYMSITKLG